MIEHNLVRATVTPPLGNVGDNEEGLCTLLQLDEYDVLLTGDASRATELRLMERLPLPDTELLIVGHHGSKSTSCEEYLRSIGGRRAIISVGKNSFGHPAAETLERLRAFGYAVSETDKDGTVEIRIHGKS